MKTLLGGVVLMLVSTGLGGEKFTEQINQAKGSFRQPAVRLNEEDILLTKSNFRPPVEFVIKAKTDHRNLRLRYAGGEVIFNWEMNEDYFRIDGGPADRKHVKGAGRIPKGEFVKIRWIVTPAYQKIFVDDELRFEHKGDYSKVREPLSIFTRGKSEVRVKSIKARRFEEKPTGKKAR